MFLFQARNEISVRLARRLNHVETTVDSREDSNLKLLVVSWNESNEAGGKGKETRRCCGEEEGGGEGDKTRGALAQGAFRATGNPRRDPTVGCRRKKDVGESSCSGSKRKDA